MHEGHFTEQIVAGIIAALKKHPDQKPRKVTVKVGEVYHLVPESVLMHYGVMVKGTSLEGVELVLNEEAMRVICSDCHKTGPVEDHHLLMCSFCHSRQVKPVSGDKVIIEHIEFER